MHNHTQVEPVEGLAKIVHENGPVVIDFYGEDLAWRPLDYGTWTVLAALKSATPASAEVEAICELLTKRDGQEFDGEVHLNSEEASYIRRLLRSLSTRLADVEAERDEIVAVLERCSEIVDRNLHRQREKVEDVPRMLRQLASRIRGEGE